MKHNLISKVSLGIAIFSLVFPVVVSAVAGGAFGSNPAFDQNANYTNVFDLGCRIINFVFAALIFLTIFFVALAAYKYLTSAGDPDKVSEANKELLYAAVAIVVGLLSRALPSIIGTIVGADVYRSFFGGC